MKFASQKFTIDFLTEVVPWGNFVLKQLAMEGFNIYLESNATWNEAFDHITSWIKQVNSILKVGIPNAHGYASL